MEVDWTPILNFQDDLDKAGLDSSSKWNSVIESYLENPTTVEYFPSTSELREKRERVKLLTNRAYQHIQEKDFDSYKQNIDQVHQLISQIYNLKSATKKTEGTESTTTGRARRVPREPATGTTGTKTKLKFRKPNQLDKITTTRDKIVIELIPALKVGNITRIESTVEINGHKFYDKIKEYFTGINNAYLKILLVVIILDLFEHNDRDDIDIQALDREELKSYAESVQSESVFAQIYINIYNMMAERKQIRKLNPIISDANTFITDNISQSQSQSQEAERAEGVSQRVTNEIIDIDGDLLTEPTDYLAHQVAKTVKRPKGLSSSIFTKWPRANFYKLYKPEERTLGEVYIMDTRAGVQIANLVAQRKGGAPTERETREKRINWFKQSLTDFKYKLPTERLVTVSFPYGIGTGLAGGNWADYRKQIEDFNQSMPNVKVKIVRKT